MQRVVNIIPFADSLQATLTTVKNGIITPSTGACITLVLGHRQATNDPATIKDFTTTQLEEMIEVTTIMGRLLKKELKGRNDNNKEQDIGTDENNESGYARPQR